MLWHFGTWLWARTVFLRLDDGQDLAEYALVIALVALVVVGAVTILGASISAVLSDIASGIILRRGS